MKIVLIIVFYMIGIFNFVFSIKSINYNENFIINLTSFNENPLSEIIPSESNVFTNLIKIYFNYHNCFTFVTEFENYYVIDFNHLNDGTVAFVQMENDDDVDTKILLENFEIGCDWFVVHSSDSVRFINLIMRVIEAAAHRQNPRMLFLPVPDDNEDNEMAQTIFNETTNYFPDVLVVDMEYNNSGSHLEFKTGDWLTGQSITLYSCSIEECNITEKELFPDKLYQLQGKKLRYATFHYPPYTFLEPKPDGTEYRIFEEFARQYNCTLTLYTDDFMWGEIFENNTGNGILGNVYEGKADIGFGALYLWYHEYFYLDYSAVYIRTGVTCLVPRVQQVSPWLLPLLPFDKTLWGLVLLTLSIGTITLYYVAKVANQFSSNWRLRFRTMADSIIRVIGLLVLQVPSAKGILPPPLPLRYIITFMELMFLLIATSYHSGLASNLTVHKYGKPIETVQDLVDSKLPWGAMHDAWIFSIRLTQERNTKTLLERFQAKSFNYLKSRGKSRTFAFSVERLQGGFFAIGDYITADAVHYLQLMKEDIYYEHVLTVVPKGSPYIANINKLINRIQSSGILLFWEREMARHYLPLEIQYGVAHSNVIEEDHEPTSLQTKQIFGSLIILTLGHVISTFVFILEHFWVWKQKRNSKIVIYPVLDK